MSGPPQLARAFALVILVLAVAAGATSSALAATTVRGARPVVIDASGPLGDLLVANLDLARAARLTGDAALDEGEWARLAAAAPDQAKDLLATEGYFDAQVTVVEDPGTAADRPIRVHVVPGPHAMIDRVTLQFDGDLDRSVSSGDADARLVEADLRRAWPLPEGSGFRNALWSDAKAQWLARLRSRGYGAASWEGTAATVDPKTHRVQLFAVVDSGPLFRAGNLMIEGLERQPEATVRNLAGFSSGAPLDEARLLDYQDRLLKTGLYDQVAVTYDPDPAQAGHATVNVHLHEQRLQQVTIAVGVSYDNSNSGSSTATTSGSQRIQPRIQLEYVNRLPFGMPVTMDDKLVWGLKEQSASVDVATQPGPRFHSWITGAAVDRVVTDEDVTESERVRFGRTSDTTRFQRLVFTQAERSVQCVNDVACVDARALSLNEQLVWRHLDNVILPTEGWTLSVQAGAGVAGGPLPAPQVEAMGLSGPHSRFGPFARLYGRYTQYWPLPSQFHFTGRVELGQVLVGDDVNVPGPELFRAGGDDSVRGYPYLSLAPTNATTTVIGGHALVTLSAEVAHPVSASLPSVWWAAFVDAGHAAAQFNDITLNHGPGVAAQGKVTLAVGPGVGVRWRSPVGPLRIDWAWGRDETTYKWQGHLSLGIGITF